jgi:CheY-like chemotaxis protein
MDMRTLLIVEDNKDDILFLKIAFEAEGINLPVEVARDGRQAVQLLSSALEGKASIPYLMLLDLKLPHIMGLDVLKWVREIPELDGVVVIVTTTSQSPADMEAAYRLKANAYLIKPSSLEKLRIQVAAVKLFWLGQNECWDATISAASKS